MATIAGGEDFLVNSTTTFGQVRQSVAALPTGGYVITFTSAETGGGRLRARFFDADGNPVGNDFPVNTTIIPNEYPDEGYVSVLTDGRLFFVWASPDNGDGGANGPGQVPYCIRGRLLEADGTPVGNDFIVNTSANSAQIMPEAAVLSDGRYVV